MGQGDRVRVLVACLSRLRASNQPIHLFIHHPTVPTGRIIVPNMADIPLGQDPRTVKATVRYPPSEHYPYGGPLLETGRVHYARPYGKSRKFTSPV